MKPEKQRIAIAEVLGWLPDDDGAGLGTWEASWVGKKLFGKQPSFREDGSVGSYTVDRVVPDYPNDERTRPEMLRLLESRELTRHMVNNVCVLMARPAELNNDMMGWNDSHLWMCLSVPQTVFCEAFLVTLNLWTDES